MLLEKIALLVLRPQFLDFFLQPLDGVVLDQFGQFTGTALETPGRFFTGGLLVRLQLVRQLFLKLSPMRLDP